MTTLIEVKASLAVSDAGEITGLAWPFATPDRVGDMITKGAFASAVLPVPMLFGHDHNDPIGAWHEATETDDGLTIKGKLLVDDLPRAREVRALVQSGAVRGLSIGFLTRKAAPRAKGGRTISELELLEVSLVTLPCHPGARVASAKSVVRALQVATALNRATAQLSKRN